MERFRIDHDLHIHSRLSLCSNDPGQTKEAILAYAETNGLAAVCMTDHYWDDLVPGAPEWYRIQNFDHIALAKPLPQGKNCRFWFGCETEMDRDFRVAVPPERYEDFDFIIVPTTHLHMNGLTIDPEKEGTPEGRALLWVRRFEELLKKDLPAGKTGIAHLTCPLVAGPGRKNYLAVLELLKEETMEPLFRKAAEKRYGIELNFDALRLRGASPEEIETELRPYRVARECGCKFYLGSDAHHPGSFTGMKEEFEERVRILELTEEDKYPLVRR